MKNDIKVMVSYMPATKPFKTDVPPTTTVGEIKAAALTEFGLAEDGTKVYKLFHDKIELTNLNQTVGDIAQNAGAINLKLEEVLVQGA